MDRIKRLSNRVLEEHKSKFGEDFTDNKKALEQITIIRSKGLKNEIAGYITKFIKREIRQKNEKLLASAPVEDAKADDDQPVENIEDAIVETIEEATKDIRQEPAAKPDPDEPVSV